MRVTSLRDARKRNGKDERKINSNIRQANEEAAATTTTTTTAGELSLSRRYSSRVHPRCH